MSAASSSWLSAAQRRPIRLPRARSRAMPVIGFLHSATLATRHDTHAAFHRGLNDMGFVEGQSVAVEYRWAENQFDRLPALAADLVRRQVAVIFAGGPPPAVAAKQATATIPIVFTSGDDPVSAGLVSSLNKPGGNVTGINVFLGVMEGKRQGLMRELLPRVETLGVLLNPNSPTIRRSWAISGGGADVGPADH